MIIESCQLLCTCHHVVGTTNLPEKFYHQTHVNHPCSKWVRERKENYNWLAEHCLYLCEEYTYRYGKIHASQDLAYWLLANSPQIRSWRYQNYLKQTGEEDDRYYPALTFQIGNYWFSEEPPQCMPDEFKVVNNPVQAYRNYYFYNKRITIDCRWTKREKPQWFMEMENNEVINKSV